MEILIFFLLADCSIKACFFFLAQTKNKNVLHTRHLQTRQNQQSLIILYSVEHPFSFFEMLSSDLVVVKGCSSAGETEFQKEAGSCL